MTGSYRDLTHDSRWSYGDAGDRWPVRFGDVWRCGPHILACGDLEHGHAGRLIKGFGTPDFAYTDPPWDKGNARSFRTKANATTPEIETYPVDFTNLLDHLVGALQYVRYDCFIEMGHRNYELLKDRIVQAGGEVIEAAKITYYRSHPALLVHCTWDDPEKALCIDELLEGQDDEKTPFTALEEVGHRGAVVFDPCLGRGLTALAAEANGMSVLGMELNPRRLAVAIDRLATLGYEPERMETR